MSALHGLGDAEVGRPAAQGRQLQRRSPRTVGSGTGRQWANGHRKRRWVPVPEVCPARCCDNSLMTLCCLKFPRTEPNRSRGSRVRADAHGSLSGSSSTATRRCPPLTTTRSSHPRSVDARPHRAMHPLCQQPRPAPARSSPSSSLTGVLGGVCGAAGGSGGLPSLCSVSSRLSAGERKVNGR